MPAPVEEQLVMPDGNVAPIEPVDSAAHVLLAQCLQQQVAVLESRHVDCRHRLRRVRIYTGCYRIETNREHV